MRSPREVSVVGGGGLFNFYVYVYVGCLCRVRLGGRLRRLYALGFVLSSDGGIDDLLASQIEETREMERQSAASGLRSPVALASAARVPSTAYPVFGHAPNWTCQFLF